MLLIRHLENFDAAPCAVAIGNFDGLHRGHKAVLAVMMEAAKAGSLTPSVLTFEPHPRRLFTPDAPIFRIEPLGQKLRRLRAAGVTLFSDPVKVPQGVVKFAAGDKSLCYFLDPDGTILELCEYR